MNDNGINKARVSLGAMICLVSYFIICLIIKAFGDLNPLSKSVKGDNLVFIQGDLQQKEIVEKIKAEGPFDLVVCDAAPLTTGNRVVDTARSTGLVKMAIWYAQTMLKSGGNFAVKIFQNGDQQALLKAMREVFTNAKGFKPQACRSESFETYLIGLGKK